MTGPELKEMAERLHVNPYYLGYALATGASSCKEAFDRDGGNHLYFAWNDARWSEQAKAEGIPRDLVAIADGAVDRHIAVCAAQASEPHKTGSKGDSAVKRESKGDGKPPSKLSSQSSPHESKGGRK